MRARRVLGLGAALSTLATLLCLFAPMYASDDGSGDATLLAVNGAGALVPLGLFLVFAATAAFAPVPAVGVAGVLAHAALTLLALLSIGVFFLPATLALVAGAVLSLRGRAERMSGWTPPSSSVVSSPPTRA